MMNTSFDEKTLWMIQEKTKFQTDNIEKVLRLMEILNEIFTHPVLNSFYALKGGTALNLFYFNIPRLSVDIDLNYQGIDREEMLINQKEHEKIFLKIFENKGYRIKRIPMAHAGGKWRLTCKNAMGQDQNLEVDLAYMLRVPLMPTEIRNSKDFCGFQAQNIRVLNIHELAAGKFCALLSRCKPRDLFDAHMLLNHITWDKQKIRECFTTYAAFNKNDFSKIDGLGEMKFDLAQFQSQLIATLPASPPPALSSEEYLNQLVTGCRRKLDIILPFSDSEKRFLQEVNHRGNIFPELITEDKIMQMTIKNHPILEWKCLNVRNYRNRKK